MSDDIGVANAFVLQVIDGKVPGCPKLHLRFVDVRDVAAAHILAVQKPEADGERFIISEREYWFEEFSAVLRAAGYEKALSRECQAGWSNFSDFSIRRHGKCHK